MSPTKASVGRDEFTIENTHAKARHDSQTSIGSDQTLTEESLPPSHQITLPDHDPLSLQKAVDTNSRPNAETATIGLRLSRANSRVRRAFKSGWTQVKQKRFTFCQAAYLFVINVTLLVIALITLLTSNQPTDVDRKSLSAETDSLKMQKAILDQGLEAAKTSNQTLESHLESLKAEKELLELQRTSLEREKVELDVHKQTLELAKWSAFHEYIAGCAAYAKADVKSDRCAEALNAFDQPPPHLPNDSTPDISKRRYLEASSNLRVPPLATQEGSGPPKSPMAAITLMANLPSTAPAATAEPAAMFNDGSNVAISVALTIFLTFVLLGAAVWWKRILAFSVSLLRRNEKSLDDFHWSEKGTEHSLEVTPSPDVTPELLVASGTGASLPVGLRNRKETTRQLTARGDIWTAAFHGDTTAVQELLTVGSLSSVHEIHPRFGTPLQAGAQGGHLKVVKIFVKMLASPNTYGGRLHSPLQAAAYSGEVEIVKLLLACDANVNAIGGSCGSPFLAAVEKGSIQMVRVLVGAGANVHQQGGTYGNALQIASFRGSESIVRLLLDAGVDINANGGCYGTALLAATMEGHTSIVKLLLQHQVNIDWVSESYGSAIQIACRQNHAEIAQLLVEHGADILVRDEQRRTPLHEAARYGQSQLAKSLLGRGVPVNLSDIDGWTALHHASLNGHDDIVEQLLNTGADVSICDKFGAQPLFRACDLGMGFLRTVELLLDAGAEINACDAKGKAAIHCESADENVNVQKLLLSRGALLNAVDDDAQTPLHRATANGNMANVQILLDAGAKINLQDNDQATALHIAVTKDLDQIALLLLQQANIDINARSASAFQEAIARGNRRLVEVMLSKGAALNAQGSCYGGVVQAAVSSQSLGLFKMLLDRGAYVNIQGGEYGSALSAAAYLGQAGMLDLLLEYGANPYIRGGRFGCVLSSARKSKASAKVKEDIIRLLKSYGAEEPIKEDMPHEHDRWILTPGGWVWLPQDSL
ncbi:MAG: hypothetical protein LQ352_007210 [Teloschistes flavicans]|nr:MAG: hypothetical protein LQ352_007210 [Teloschistes flavicans]